MLCYTMLYYTILCYAILLGLPLDAAPGGIHQPAEHEAQRERRRQEGGQRRVLPADDADRGEEADGGLDDDGREVEHLAHRGTAVADEGAQLPEVALLEVVEVLAEQSLEQLHLELLHHARLPPHVQPRAPKLRQLRDGLGDDHRADGLPHGASATATCLRGAKWVPRKGV